jgi:hypothetical protein
MDTETRNIAIIAAVLAITVGVIWRVSFHPPPYVPAQGQLSITDAALFKDILKLHQPAMEWSSSSNTPSMSVPLSGHYIALWRHTPFDSIATGDIVIFRLPGDPRAFVHQVVDRDPHALLVKGSGNATYDGWIPAEQVLGTLDAVIFHRPAED